MIKNKLLSYALIAALIMPQSLWACTGIELKTEDGKFLSARSIEWGAYELKSNLVLMPKGVKFQAYTSLGEQNGHKWTGKYGFVGISLVYDTYIGEGMNEAGLNAGMFYFPGYGSLAKYEKRKNSKSLIDMNLTTWILSNFATVEEVKKNIDKIIVVPVGYDKNGNPLPTAHWRVTDARGGSIVIEITDGGKVNVYDNKVGVLTNSPQFPWQVTNLNNYVNLKPGTAKGFGANGIQIKSFGATSSLLGLPGDYTPPSRFVRAFFAINTAPKMPNAEKGIRQAFQILKGFTIPIGMEFAPGEKVPNIPSATQWTALSNLSDREFYYNTMYNPLVRKVDLKKIDFETAQKTVFPLETQLEPVFKEIYFN